MTKFNTKNHLGKDRVYRKVPGTSGIQRLLQWNGKEYVPSTYEARRYDDRKKRNKKSFPTLAEARDWQQGKNGAIEETAIDSGMNFGDVINEWQKRVFPTIAEGTRMQYEKLVRLYVSQLAPLGIYEVTSRRIDEWIDSLKDPKGLGMKSKIRKSFDHELMVLTMILRYYEDYYDDPKFRLPVKKRHREAVKLSVSGKIVSKDISEEEFFRFREQLANIANGEMYAKLATVQYYQALRISEAAAIHWEDIFLNEQIPMNSRLKICRSVFWPRKKGMKPSVNNGFKNAKANGGLKEQPMFPETHRVLNAMRPDQASGLVFTVEGKLLEYRQVQHAYDRAFKLAGLPYSATHIMRHGGTRRVFNMNGDLSVAQQLLGNTDIETTMVYAQREKSALTSVAHKEWAKQNESSETGRNWSQKKEN